MTSIKNPRLRIELVAMLVGISILGEVPQVMAQPGNPGPNPATQTVVDLGDVTIGTPITSADIQVAAGATVWFQFHLLTAISPLVNWLDLDTAGPSPTGLVNTEMCLYDARANKINENNDSGGSSGPGGNGWAAAMSFGGGSGQKISGDAPGWGGGFMSDGIHGQTLGAGVYWVAVVGYNADFSQDPNPNWQISTNATTAGTVRLRVLSGEVPSTYWNERHHGEDAGETPGNAQVVEGNGPLTKIITSFPPGGRDMFKIRICDGAAFQAVAQSTTGGGGAYRSRLFLFDALGRGVLAINNTNANTDTTLRVPNGFPALLAGDYYLAVSSYCGGLSGYGAAVPYGPTDQILWDFAINGNNVSIPPSGPDAASPMVYWGRQANCESDGTYWVRLALSGACHVPVASSCPIDFNGDGTENLFDFAEFQNCFDGP